LGPPITLFLFFDSDSMAFYKKQFTAVIIHVGVDG